MTLANVETVDRFYDAYLRRDRDLVASLVHPEVEWHTLAGPIVGVDLVKGRDDLVAFMFEQVLEGLPDFEARAEEVTELGEDEVLVVARYTAHGSATGAAVEMHTAAIYRLADGLIVSFREFPSRADALDARK